MAQSVGVKDKDALRNRHENLLRRAAERTRRQCEGLSLRIMVAATDEQYWHLRALKTARERKLASQLCELNRLLDRRTIGSQVQAA